MRDWPNYELPLEKVENVRLMDQQQMQHVVEQSAPGMLVGGVVFGGLGAMVGGRVKTKNRVSIHHIIVVDYESDGKKQIILDVTPNTGWPAAERVIKRFKELKPVPNSTVQL